LNQVSIFDVKKLLEAAELPTHDELFEFTDKTSDILENEITSYREATCSGYSGSLLDFKNSELPLIVVPDIHARPFFLGNILNFVLPEDFIKHTSMTVFEALEKKLVLVVCVGDALHTERKTRERWAAAEAEFDSGIVTGPAMSSEMLDGLSLLSGLMYLKEAFPENFHFLKGNHENILNETGNGDFAFRKFSDEGSMVRDFISEYYGDDILYMLSCVEKSLPLMAVTGNCVVSHAEPKKAYTREQLVNAKDCKGVVEGLTWTDNGDAEEGSVEEVIKAVCGCEDKFAVGNYTYLGGHRPVPGNYLLRQNGKYVQIHNPSKQNIALVRPDRKFNPDTDIVSVEISE